MEQYRPRENKSSSPTKTLSFMKHEGSLMGPQVVSILDQMKPLHTLTPHFLWSISILSFQLHSRTHAVSSLQDFKPQCCWISHPFHACYMTHIQRISILWVCLEVWWYNINIQLILSVFPSRRACPYQHLIIIYFFTNLHFSPIN
jgi:hypothetical protein